MGWMIPTVQEAATWFILYFYVWVRLPPGLRIFIRITTGIVCMMIVIAVTRITDGIFWTILAESGKNFWELLKLFPNFVVYVVTGK